MKGDLILGRQDEKRDPSLSYEQNITDACLGWRASIKILEQLAPGNRLRSVVGLRPYRTPEPGHR